MPFTARGLRYHPEQNYPLLYAYLHRNAQRFLGSLKYDAFEVDTVIGHVVEQLVRLGLFGGGDKTSVTALDNLTDAQFYAFLNSSVRNKAIDRLRRKRIKITPAAEWEYPEEQGGDDNLLDGASASLWGTVPFTTPEEITLHLASQQELRDLLKHCISRLSTAPNQLQAVLQELQEMGAEKLLQAITEELHVVVSASSPKNPHMSQHKDHAHRKLRYCLQRQSTNLTVTIALRLTEYAALSKSTNDYVVAIQTLAQDDLSEGDVRSGLSELAAEGLLSWHDEQVVSLTTAQRRRLARFYREE